MKITRIAKYHLLVSIGIVSATTSFAASAVAVNKTTGAYGYAYGKKTEAEAKTAAIANCPGGGEIIASSPKDGHGAVLRSVNNFKDGQPVTVKALLAQANAVGVRKPGTGECADCIFMEIWYDNATSSDKEKFEGVGGKNGPEELKPDINIRRNGEYIDVTVIEGREFKNGFGLKYMRPDAKSGLMNKTEYIMGLKDGKLSCYDQQEGMDPTLTREIYYKQGYQTGFNRSIGRGGNVENYEEYKKGVKDGFFYKCNLNGQIEEQGYYKNNKLNGMWCSYVASTGKPEEKGYYDMGTKTGEWTSYSKLTGKLTEKGTYDLGLKTGEWTRYSDKTGLLEEKGKYELGKKEGKWISYQPDGKTVKKEKNYVGGTLVN